MDKRTGWLAELKVGDEVAIKISGYSGGEYSIHYITKVTPTGRIVAGHTTFDPQGVEMGSNVWYRDRLVPITDELREYDERRKLLRRLGGIDWSKYKTTQLKQVMDILGLNL